MTGAKLRTHLLETPIRSGSCHGRSLGLPPRIPTSKNAPTQLEATSYLSHAFLVVHRSLGSALGLAQAHQTASGTVDANLCLKRQGDLHSKGYLPGATAI